MNSNYSSMISMESDGNARCFDSSYNSYPTYFDYGATSKSEAIDYNPWSNSIPTQNLLNIHTPNSIRESMATPTTPSQMMENLVPLQVSQMNTSAMISSTHHPYHHSYPGSSCTGATDPTAWFNAVDYVSPSNTYRPYAYGNTHFHDQTQWTATPPSMMMKVDSNYSSSCYIDSSSHHQQSFSDSKEENSDYCETTTSTSVKQNFTPVPPRNPVNGKTRTRDKYRIVYTDHQRYELEHEFNKSKYITIPRKAALSSTLGLSERQIKIWFQNRRAKERKLNKKRHDICSRQLNHSTDTDSPSEGDFESPTYYPNY